MCFVADPPFWLPMLPWRQYSVLLSRFCLEISLSLLHVFIAYSLSPRCIMAVVHRECSRATITRWLISRQTSSGHQVTTDCHTVALWAPLAAMTRSEDLCLASMTSNKQHVSSASQYSNKRSSCTALKKRGSQCPFQSRRMKLIQKLKRRL
jgi:hypothetical protein